MKRIKLIIVLGFCLLSVIYFIHTDSPILIELSMILALFMWQHERERVECLEEEIKAIDEIQKIIKLDNFNRENDLIDRCQGAEKECAYLRVQMKAQIQQNELNRNLNASFGYDNTFSLVNPENAYFVKDTVKVDEVDGTNDKPAVPGNACTKNEPKKEKARKQKGREVLS